MPRRRGRLSTWYRARSLRSRFALLTAAAVAVAIAASALACWFIVEKQLYDQVRNDLQSVPPPQAATLQRPCPSTPEAALAQAQTDQTAGDLPMLPRGGPAPRDTQFVWADQGCVSVPYGATRAIVIQPGDMASALSLKPNQAIIRDGRYTNGDPAMVRLTLGRGPAHNSIVVMVATPTKPVEESLRQLAFLLGGVALGGVILAGLAGRLVARSALKPVDHLTDAVEHIARTEEVGTTIPVQGDDEIARLSTSFNSMSTALANSRERQTRLIADAG
ncbi:hypothetical protein VR45_20385, partial [Streptomyces sp. NRRL S-495]